jgi:hypothetical protein
VFRTVRNHPGIDHRHEVLQHSRIWRPVNENFGTLLLSFPVGKPNHEAASQALENCNLCLLGHPKWRIDTRDGIQLREQLTTAGIITAERENDQPQQGTWGESPHE